MIQFGALAPDLQAQGTHLVTANNCVSYGAHYAPILSPVEYSNASSEAIKSAFSIKSSAGTSYNFFGGTAKLQLIQGATFSDVSNVGGYTTASNQTWEWTAFGDRVIATNNFDPPQSFVMGSSTTFAALAGSPPVAKCVATVRGFVMFGNLTANKNRLHWSALENPADYVVNPSGTQSDTQDLFGETNVGQIMKIVGGEAATIFCENGIFRGTYAGTPFIFTFDQIIQNNGTLAAGSVAAYGDKIFFLGLDGFYMLTGGQAIPIGDNTINKTFFNEVYSAEYYRIQSAIDVANSLYMVAYPTATGVLGKLLTYNWTTQKWTTITPGNIETIFQFLSETANSDSISATIGDPDGGTYSSTLLDSNLFIGGVPSLACVNTSHKVATFSGTPLTATIEMAEQGSQQLTLIKKVRPQIEGNAPTITVEVGSRDTAYSPVTYTAPSTVNSNGEACLFSTGRYHRARVTINGQWTKAHGIDFDAAQKGRY